ncbi:pantoate--beta-alanine ligase [Jeotgalibacillus sp. S-D1]|uniref:pantoate--beta-alanine ligase n=1 Tax=Jeotgalibacillus sp. S-D1 TaxID=2552189 RepID=UPI00105A8FFA|nr:pantoate--beta-alanine ligase [Jeotgalibacillus sp. S-D1]TDL34757.1 pantoate--beta-alanine ligase [Jeotgalibacillus sp. S-D1]
MKMITSVSQMQSISKELKSSGKKIGFVPTMGYLHEGHLTLVTQSVKECDVTVMSIFVNPLQFGPNEDFDQYPRDIDRDFALAKSAGADLLFYPSVKELYPEELPVKMTALKRTNVLCGAKRPGHFDGVVSVLTLLFHIVQPDRAYFGQKDAQQVAVVKGLVEGYFFPVQIVTVETVREEDGLAKSSRNVYLTDKERNEAPVLYQSLIKGKEMLGTKTADQVISLMASNIQENTSGKIDYIEILSYPELLPINNKTGQFIIALAVQFEHARLIDNVVFTPEEEELCIVQ